MTPSVAYLSFKRVPASMRAHVLDDLPDDLPDPAPGDAPALQSGTPVAAPAWPNPSTLRLLCLLTNRFLDEVRHGQDRDVLLVTLHCIDEALGSGQGRAVARPADWQLARRNVAATARRLETGEPAGRQTLMHALDGLVAWIVLVRSDDAESTAPSTGQ